MENRMARSRHGSKRKVSLDIGLFQKEVEEAVRGVIAMEAEERKDKCIKEVRFQYDLQKALLGVLKDHGKTREDILEIYSYDSKSEAGEFLRDLLCPYPEDFPKRIVELCGFVAGDQE